MDQTSKEDELKTQFVTREGTYRLNLSEYSRPNRVGYTSNQNSPQVRVSLVAIPSESVAGGSVADRRGNTVNGNGPDDLQVNQISSTTSSGIDHLSNGPPGGGGGGQQSRLTNNNNHHSVGGGGNSAVMSAGDRICFNFGKELFVYPYRGMKKVGNIILALFTFYCTHYYKV